MDFALSFSLPTDWSPCDLCARGDRHFNLDECEADPRETAEEDGEAGHDEDGTPGTNLAGTRRESMMYRPVYETHAGFDSPFLEWAVMAARKGN